MKKPILAFALFAVFLALSSRPCAAQVENPRVEWMKGGLGIMVHWLFPSYADGDSKEIDRLTDGFDLDGFMRDFDATGAQWLIFTIGQNSGAYASPNSAIEKYAGSGHTPRRDLVLEIAEAVKARGKRFIAYIPCEIRENSSMIEGFEWNKDIQNPKTEFQNKWLEVLREWSLRFGKNCDGWWVDGAFSDIAPHIRWDDWHAALRAGNPNSILTFNSGFSSLYRIPVLHPNHDYSAGEVIVLIDGKVRMTMDNKNPILWMPNSAYLESTKTLHHALLPIDSFWGAYSNWSEWVNPPWSEYDSAGLRKIRPCVYSDDEISLFVKNFTSVGGAVTINMGITESGRLSPSTIEQVSKISRALKGK